MASPLQISESLPLGRLSRLLPVEMVRIQMALHVVVWTLAPALLYTALPLDVVESYVHGPEWVLSTLKHPALPSWVLETTRVVTGIAGWPAYLVSQLFIAATLGIVFLLGRDLLGAERAAIGTLALSGLVYFSWVSIEFNHNVALMPLWTAYFLCLWRAVDGGRLVWWCAAGVCAALMMYTKLSAAIGILAGVFWLLLDARGRAALLRPQAWLGAALAAALVVPLYLSLTASNFAPLVYAAARAEGAPNTGIGRFLGAQVLALIGVGVLLAIAGWLAPPQPSRPAGERVQRFLLMATFAPLVMVIVGALVTHSGLRSAWGASMLSFAGLLAVAYLPRFGTGQLRIVFVGACVVCLVAPVVFTAVYVRERAGSARMPRSSWPQAELAAAARAAWQAETGQPLRYVSGPFWPAGLVALTGGPMPRVIVDGNLAAARGVSLDDVRRAGVLILATHGEPVTPADLAGLPPARKIGSIVVPFRHNRKGQTVTLRYAIIAPP